jgi:hypothetical protein
MTIITRIPNKKRKDVEDDYYIVNKKIVLAQAEIDIIKSSLERLPHNLYKELNIGLIIGRLVPK